MSATLLDERQYRKLLEVTLPVAIRTEPEYRRLLHSAVALMDKPENEMSEEEGRLLELLGILTTNTKTGRTRFPRPNRIRCWPICSKRKT